ncbi:metastasis-associated protein MTA3 [Folsomia candida]|uniref:Metastasis-associated protein MTA1 n=1 Tax=Folsomia candida TaxID=158441 RepID=A0A226EQB2_FOLCA|nr:metastasis-associated protein MTA3 [Folsomia candida]OXA59815.1 Metastasis-associated protein MTA1 [Folsomia candida]
MDYKKVHNSFKKEFRIVGEEESPQSLMTSNNMYRIGDYVFFEAAPTLPYQIRRIEELNKTPNGNVEAKTMCFFRRKDLPQSLTMLADRHYSALEEDEWKDRDGLSTKQKHLLKHRELFLSRQIETLPATQIRGKCSVTLLNETESLLSYLNKDDTFFYSLVYDPQQKTLLADRGEIRVGQRYQAESVKPRLKEGESDERELTEMETMIWTPEHGLTDKQIDQFLVISRSVGTFARSLDSSSSIKQPSLHMSAAAASRDVTLFHAMDTLHKYSYDVSSAVSALVPSSGPVLCRDEMEEWSASEANLFEEALEKYGKDFTDIRSDFLPWKTLKNIVEYYYMWKTTDRYVQQKRVKAAEAESKLKQIFIPNYNKPNPAALSSKGMMNGNGEQLIPGKPCESCSSAMSIQWFAWTGPTGAQARLCNPCWNYWRKYGGFKIANKSLTDGEIEMTKKPKVDPPSDDGEAPVDLGSIASSIPVERSLGLLQTRVHRCAVAGCGKDFKMKNQLARHYAASHGFSMRSGSPRPVMKTRTAFYLHTTPMTRVSRRICSDILKTRHATRSPFWPINVMLVKQECQLRVNGKTSEELKPLVNGRTRKSAGASVTEVSYKLGQSDRSNPEWLLLTEKGKIPQPEKIAYPKPPKAPDGTLIYERVPDKQICVSVNSISPSSHLKRRGYEELNGIDGPPTKRLAWDPTANPTAPRSNSRGGSPSPLSSQHLPATAAMNYRTVMNHLNGNKAKMTAVTRIGSRKQIISWMDAPDDLYFVSNSETKKVRRLLSTSELRRLARSPTKKSSNKALSDSASSVTVMPAAAAALAASALVIPPPSRSPMST